MAKDTPEKPDDPGRQPIPPALRRRLQQCFEHGSKSAAKNDFNYATDMFVQCVAEDPGNPLYLKQFLANLGKKYNNNKKGAGLMSMGSLNMAKGSLKKAAYSKDWKAVIKNGIEVLKLNPWDISTLVAMADACNEMHYDESQLTYLKQALDVDPKDAEVNRRCGRALAAQGHFDQAITCWHRVEQAKPGDEEAAKAIGDLAVEKTISKGGYEDAESGQDVRADKGVGGDRAADVENKLTPVQRLEKAIAKKPDEVGLYLELSDLHTREEQHKLAEEALRKALEVSGGDVMVRERLEDAEMRSSRHQVAMAQRKAEKEKTPEAIELLKKMKGALNAAELRIFSIRAERHPNNLRYKFEMGLRLKKAGQYQEAIKAFQAASGDPKTKAKTHFELGECFQNIKQYKLAMQNYETALELLPTREVDERKIALYRAGRLALALAEKNLGNGDPQGKVDLDKADKHLGELASLEFGFKDVPQLLDKIAKIRHKG